VINGLALLGVKDVHFLGEEDYAILPDSAIVRKIARVLRQIRPDVVITHHPFDQPSYMLLDAHGVAARCTMQAISAASRPDPDDPAPPAPQPAQILWHIMHPFHPMAVRYDFWWDLSIDISAVVELKIAALRMISTQHWDRYAPKYVEAQSGSAGVLSQTGHAELFIRNVPEVHAQLPVSEFQRRLNKQTPHEIWSRMSRIVEPTSRP
jgi:LmbE family N-acetylglucosaminyl deacetylase